MEKPKSKSQIMRQEVVSELGISSDLNKEFISQASYYAHWGFRAVRAADKVRRLEESKELVFGELYAEYRSQHEDAKENDCKSYIRQQDKYKQVSDELNRAVTEAEILKVAVKAFEMRRDMLIQLGAQYRTEYDSTDMSLKAATHRANRVVKDSMQKKGQ